MSTLWFSSDQHFFHKNICRFSNRPFSSLEEMHETFINNINEKIKERDAFYIIGDYSFGNFKDTKELTDRIKCKNLILVRGNHDRMRDGEYLRLGFKQVHKYLEIKHNRTLYVLSHYPFLVWRNSHHGSRNLTAHSHGSLNEVHKETTRLDVGVDCHYYYPISLEEVEAIMSTRTYKPVDHHE